MRIKKYKGRLIYTGKKMNRMSILEAGITIFLQNYGLEITVKELIIVNYQLLVKHVKNM